jgi:hypothetical protein
MQAGDGTDPTTMLKCDGMPEAADALAVTMRRESAENTRW